MKTSYQKGVFAEKWACIYLMLKGYRILNLRYKTKLGEIDIIARKNKTIVFIEVKHRQTEKDSAEAISAQSQQRIVNAAKTFISKNTQYVDFAFRFDALLFISPLSIKHLDNAWSVSSY